MGAMASQITSLPIVYSTVYSDADQRKHQSSATLAFVWGIHRWPVNSPHKWPVTRKTFRFDDVILRIRSASDSIEAYFQTFECRARVNRGQLRCRAVYTAVQRPPVKVMHGWIIIHHIKSRMSLLIQSIFLRMGYLEDHRCNVVKGKQIISKLYVFLIMYLVIHASEMWTLLLSVMELHAIEKHVKEFSLKREAKVSKHCVIVWINSTIRYIFFSCCVLTFGF